MSAQPRRFRRLFFIGVPMAVVGALLWPASTRQGVNFQVSTHSIPSYVKIIDFFHRHYQYRFVARDITRDLTSDRARVLAVFDWTRRHIRAVPQGWPIVDDHILNIMIRGYGAEDQMADVFTTLSTYAGVPAFWQQMRTERGDGWQVLAFARVDGRWAMFDVANNVVLRDQQGRLADLAALYADPALMATVAAMPAPDGVPYSRYLERLRPLPVPHPLRAEQQMPVARCLFELRKILHLPTRHTLVGTP